jgi:host factor-I protein
MPSQNLQDAFLNSARKERAPVTIYLTSGVKLSGRVKGFDKYCVVFETNHQEQLIFKHAISTVVSPRHGYGGGLGPRSSDGPGRGAPDRPPTPGAAPAAEPDAPE